MNHPGDLTVVTSKPKPDVVFVSDIAALCIEIAQKVVRFGGGLGQTTIGIRIASGHIVPVSY